MNYSDIPILLETNHSSFNPELLALAKTISKEAQWYHSEQRKKLHLSAVVVNNFVNHLYAQAAHFLGSKETFKMLLPLIHETTARLADEEPAKLQTGPAIRGDEAVIQEHLNLLKEHPQLQDLYQAMTRSIASLKGHE